MNVYMYGGTSRSNATETMITNNEQALVGQNYTMDYLKGVVIVAYPNEDATTDFEFKYWVDSYNSPPETFNEIVERIKA